MDFLNRAFAQLRDLFLSMTPGARITAGLLLGVVVISLGYLFMHRPSDLDDYLLGGEPFPASHIPAMQAAFGKAGLKCEVDGARIRVPHGQQTVYMAALAENNALPPNFFAALDGLLNMGSAFDSKDQREQRVKVTKQKLLSLIITSMNGIQNANVMYDTEIKGGFKREKVTTASVIVQPEGSQDLKESLAPSLRHLVAGAIAGLTPENVTVVDKNSGRTFHGGSGGRGNPMEDAYGARKQMYEQQWKDKIFDALSYVPGVNVATNVELNREQKHLTKSVKHDPKPVPYRTTEKTRSLTQNGETPGGSPGLGAQGNVPVAMAVSQSVGSTQDEEESQQDQLNVVSSTSEEKESAGLTPVRVSASIGIPSRYFAKVWRERNPTAPNEDPKTPEKSDLDRIQQEEVAKVQNAVAALLPEVEGVTDPVELVTVTVFQDITPEEIPKPGFGHSAVTWLGQYWSTLGMSLLAMFSLVMLRSMVRANPDAETGAAASSGQAESGEAEPEESPPENRIRTFQTERSMRDELSELVTQDADTAANILRTWIGAGGTRS